MISLVKILIGLLALQSVTCGGVTTQPNNCISFIVGPQTGCEWMCNYCANQLGTNNYYFQDNVCTYQTGGCVGSPLAGKTYTCCSTGLHTQLQAYPNEL